MERRDGQDRNVVHADGVQRHRRRRRHAPRIPDHRDRKYGLQTHGDRYPDGGRRYAGDAPGRADGVYPDAEVTVDPKQIEFNADEIVPVDVSFTTNMGDVYAVSRDEDADWISWEDLGGNVIRFTAAPWDDEEQPRTANVYITVGSEETSAATAKIPVTQLAKDLYCYVWGASLFDYDRFELARRMTKSEAGVYRFDAYFTAGNAPEIRINTVLARRLLPRLRACGRRADRHAQFGGGCGSRGACDRHRRHAYADHRSQCDDLHPVAHSDRQLHARRRGAACPSKAFRTKEGGVKIWMTRNLNWNGGPEIGAMKLGSRLVPAYSGSATSGGYDPQDPYIERNPAYDEEESGGSVKGDQAVTDRHGRLYTLDEILLGTPAGGLGRGITSIEWPSAYNVGFDVRRCRRHADHGRASSSPRR